jgi:hypothetical protein
MITDFCLNYSFTNILQSPNKYEILTDLSRVEFDSRSILNSSKSTNSNLDLIKNKIIEEVSSQIPKWRNEFLEKYGWSVDIVVEGSLNTSNFVGTKIDTPEVIEVDISIRLPNHLNPLDPNIKKIITEITGAEFSYDCSLNYWGQEVSSSFFYLYRELDTANSDLNIKKIEYEIFVRRKQDGIAFSDYWERIFSKSELEAQFKERQKAKIDNDLDAYMLSKYQHNVNSRWRIIAGWHFGFLGNIPEKYRKEVADWGKWKNIGLYYKDRLILPTAPAFDAPSWVRKAWGEC